ncbi:MAG: Rab family GTPase [Candidatus Odinarchaeota archaeon]
MNFRQYLKKFRRVRKILLLGSGAVGKTSLVKVLKAEKSLREIDGGLKYHRTPFMELETVKTSTLVRDSEEDGVFQLWDLAGQPDLPVHAIRDIAKTTLGSVDLVILVFASNSIQTLIEVANWMKFVEKFYSKNISNKEPDYVLVRNKIDLECSMSQGFIDHVKEADKRIINYFEISCITGEGLNELKEWLVNHCFK